MPIDQNTYALSIQLALESQAAFDSLDDFGAHVTDLEEEVASAAQKAIQGLGDIAAQANQTLMDVGKLLTDIDTSTFKITTNFADATKELRDQFDTSEEQRKKFEKESDRREKMFKLQQDLSEELQTHLDLQQEFLALTQQVISSVGLKNDGHREQNGLLGTDVDLISNINDGLDGSVQQTRRLNRHLGRNAITWRTIWGWIKQADADTEKFVTTNYRAYGSQQQLVQGARAMAMANGVAYESAIEAYAVMGGMKVPREELDKYAVAVAQANRTTGVSIQTTGDYVNRLRTAGMSLTGIEHNLAKTGEAMRKFGLNTRDVNALMNQSAANTKNAARIFGLAGDELAQWEEHRMAMAGFAKQAGMNAEEMAGFENWILNDVAALEQFKAMTNTSETGLDGFRLAMLRSGIATDQQMKALEEGVRNGSRSQTELLAMQEAMVNVQYGGNRAAFEAARAQGKLAQELGITGKNIEEVNKLNEIYANTLATQNEEANYTFTRQLKLLTDKIWIAGASVIQFITDALLPLIYAMNEVVSAISWVLGKIGDFIRWMEQIPVIGQVVSFLKWTVGVLMALGLAFLFVSGAVISFSTILGGFGGLMSRVTAGVQAFANIILILVRTLGQAIVIILTSIGEGLQNLGNSIKGVMVPLIALGFALMMAGIGAYFLALGVRTLAEVGWAAVPAMIGLILGVALLGLVLVGLAMLVQGPVALGLAILALAILAVGVAALMMGTGIYMAGLGLSLMAGILSLELIGKFYLLGLAMVSLGIMSIAAAPGIYILAAGMLMLSVAALIMSAAFYVIAAAIQMIGVDALPQMAEAVLEAAKKFAMAGFFFMVAGGAFALGGIAMAVALAIMVPVALLMLAVGPALLVGGLLMVAGALLVSIAGLLILVGGTSMLVGGLALFTGLSMVLMATGMLLASGVGMVAGAALLALGAAGLVIAGELMVVGAVALMAGSVLLMGAALLLDYAVPLLTVSGESLITAAADLITGSAMMVEAGAQMLVAGASLLAGTVMLAGAGAALLAGVFLFGLATGTLQSVAEAVAGGAALMLQGAVAFYQAVTILQSVAGHLQGAGVGLVAGAAYLIAAGLDLGQGAALLTAGAGLLIAASAAMLVAGYALSRASILLLAGSAFYLAAMGVLVSGAAMLDSAARSILFSSVLLRTAAEILPAASAEILWAMNSLLMSGVTAVEAGAALLAGSAGLALSAASMVEAATLLTFAGALLRPAAWSIYSGLLWVEMAVYRFGKTLGLVQKVGAAIALLASSFMMLHHTPLSGLRDLSAEVMSSLPNVEKIATGLMVAAKQLDQGVKAFEGPAERLNGLLSRLTETMTAFGSGLTLADDVAKLAEMLDNYANLLENASDRIETAVATKAIPAMRAAEQSGIKDTVKSEAISTVQLIDKTDGEARDNSTETDRLLVKLNDTMTAVKDALLAEGGGEVGDILALLQAYLPNMNKGDSGLGSEFNSWSR